MNGYGEKHNSTLAAVSPIPVILIFTIFPSVALYMVYVGYVKEVIAENYIESAVRHGSVGPHELRLQRHGEFSNVILTNRISPAPQLSRK